MERAGRPVIIMDNADCDCHEVGDQLPEKSFRTQVIRDALSQEIKRDDQFGALVTFETKSLDPTDMLTYMELAHGKTYVVKLAAQLKQVEATELTALASGNIETPISKGSRKAIAASIGAVIGAVDNVVNGIASRIFCNIRPPGHHACAGSAMGFCYVNNMAIAIQYYIVKRPGSKVVCFDWDNHHGNGLEEAFYKRADVKYISIHANWKHSYPAGSGNPKRKGAHNNILNISLIEGSGHVAAIDAFDSQVMPAIIDFEPTVIFISCGFDAHELDPVGTLAYETKTYRVMTDKLVAFANESTEKPAIISMLEGGYHPKVLRDASLVHVRALAEI